MPRPTTPLTPLHLRTFFLRHFSPTPTPTPTPYPPHLPKPLLSLSKPLFLSPPKNPFSLSSLKPFSTSPPIQENPLSHSLSAELTKEFSSSESSISLPQRLDLSYSHIELTPALILSTLNLSPNAGRSILGFLKWVLSRSNFDVTDEVVSYFVDYFGRRKDFKAVNEVLESSRGVVGDKTLGACVDRLVRAGRPTQVVSFFDTMEKDYGFVRNLDSLKLVVGKLCEHGFASYAEKLVKSLANEFFPDECVCDLLVKGWCVDKKLDEAKRLVGEMNRGGFEIGAVAYNAMLDCVCKLCREKDPFRLQSEAENVLVEMDVAGVPRNVETFNVLISNLCKIRKTEDAMSLFQRMGEWGCNPNEITFLVLIKSLYQAARIGEGDEMIDRMKSAGFGNALDKKAYYEFLTILCGIERIDHSMSVFAKMKEDGCKPGTKTYDLLINKLCAHGKSEKANALFKEAGGNGILAIPPSSYKVDPRFAKKPAVTKKEKKRETLPEKMARKRSTLKKIRLSFVKKPKKTSTRAY
ncbi:pentatricopeptide repeat-containing protein PNM1, mitochondrial [Heracleum sosnowskyi]|uniref:Pentatricopeptide repeat-containing protein PNM1, mitochondrial n=1 Tax=Heracleum sosnowskyi TaxID=360622 RepID=A0AAD8M5T4_9APIA|nr:pentatricopeptide repeat-containing protein PNM1, mitochondrial [Heracleum sosnowskyi]